MKVFARLKARLFDESHPMDYRISIIFLVVALFASVLSAITNTLLQKGVLGIAFQWLFIAVTGVFLFAGHTVRLRLFRPLVIMVVFVYIPFLFTQTAGYDGTALMFSLLGVFCLSVAFEGRLRIILTAANTVLLMGMCMLDYFFPALIIPHDGPQAKLVDQLVALAVTMSAAALLSIYIIDALKKALSTRRMSWTDWSIKTAT